MSELYIGLMSGTSMDGIDAVLVDFSEPTPTCLAHHHMPLPSELKQRLENTQGKNSIDFIELGSLDTAMGRAFSDCVNTLLNEHNIDKHNITAIGSHGQTLFHHPNGNEPFTLQIGDPNSIATNTGITTIAGFRRRDMALGGQGAPLAPGFHAYLFGDKAPCCFVNIGGIANITVMHPDKKTIGYDTGPGNTLLDHWCQTHLNQPFDRDGAWAKAHDVNQELLQTLLDDPYFALPYPKSTGRESFNTAWLNERLAHFSELDPGVIQASLTAFTATHIANALNEHLDSGNVWVAGGGVHNKALMQALSEQCPTLNMQNTETIGIHPQWIEAMAFAWLAHQTYHGKPGNLPSVTGASDTAVLGGVWGS